MRLSISLILGLFLGTIGAPSGAPEHGRPLDGGIVGDIRVWIATTHRAGVDLLLIGRHTFFGPRFTPQQSKVAVVVIDEETYRTQPFNNLPKVAWTPALARVIEKLHRAGAKVIGLDQIYPTSLDRRDLLPGFDKPMLKAFYKVGRAGRLVLGETRLSRQILRPYRGQIMAIGGTANLAPLNLLTDRDEIVRRHPVRFVTESGQPRPSFAAELARRAGIAVPARDFMINFDTGARDLPSFSLADIHACTGEKGARFLAEHFKDRVVLIGSALDVEDRHRGAKRFTNQRDRTYRPDRCALEYDPVRFGELVSRRSMPGVFIHAAAINTMARGNRLVLPGRLGNFAIIAGVTMAMSLLFFSLSPLAGMIAGLFAGAGQATAAFFAFQSDFVLPIVAMALASFFCFAVVYAYRFTIEDRTKRRIHNAFQHYLAPALVDQLAERADSLALGGEVRRVTVWFSDIVGYTSISEALADEPEKLVEVVNRYFTTLCECVEKHNGYIDKFIGDAALCVWGAPLDDAEADRHALQAAVECLEALEKFNRDVVVGEYGLPPIGTRIGINSGDAVVGNMGSTTRFNYTVTGDTVNLASRLEGANKVYGTLVMIGEDTARAAGEGFALRRLDRLIVKGKSKPITVFELIGRRRDVDDIRAAQLATFEDALDLYYRREFTGARAAFAELAADDPVAALYRERCVHLLSEPPSKDWDGSFTMTSK